MLPVHVGVVVGNPDVLTEAVMRVPVVPFVEVAVAGCTTAQFPQLDLYPLGRKFTCVPAGLVTLMVCAAGTDVPICQAKLSCVGVNVSVGAPVVVTVTGIVSR